MNPVDTLKAGKANTLSVIIPVLHEASSIGPAVEHLFTLGGNAPPEVILVDGDAEGSTIRKLERPDVITASCEPGRGRQLNLGAKLASGDILIFLHADTRLPRNALFRVQAVMQDERWAAGAFDLGISSPRWVFRVTERYAAVRTRITRVPFGDQAIFIRRSYFENLGGYAPIPLMEDVELMRRIKDRGDRICIIPEKVMTSSRRWDNEGILCCTFRNWTIQAAYALGADPGRLARWYRPHSEP